MEVFCMAYLVRTTLDELATLTDELELNDRVIFTTEDPDELEYYKLQPCKYNLIYKSKLLYESDYVIIIGLIDGHCTVAKDIHILSNGNVEDEDSRIDGIKEFLEEYYKKYMEKNKDEHIYLILN
jgi:hypothetical protein